MSGSPFFFGQTVSGQAFTDRIEEKKRLYDNLVNGINTVIISPRRWGKSSLVEEVFRQIKKNEKNKKTLIIDLFSVADEQEFLEKLAREVIKASSDKWEDWVRQSKAFFKSLVPVISFGNDPVHDFSLRFDIQELPKHADEILNLAEEIAVKKNIEFIIGLDEFQNLNHFARPVAFEKKMRAVWQRQKHVTYCIFGSKRHMMTDIFNNPSKAFYRFGDVIFLRKISSEEWAKFIQTNFEKTNKHITEKQALQIAGLMDNHSWYVQQLAHYVWVNTKQKVTGHIIDNALQEIINVNKPFFQNQLEHLSTTQKNLLKAIIAGETKLTSAGVMQKYKLGTPRNVSKNKQILIQNDIIDIPAGKKIEFLDPVFKIWLQQEYLIK
jgi:Cdc6-like AAA superfamily ATPase